MYFKKPTTEMLGPEVATRHVHVIEALSWSVSDYQFAVNRGS